MKKFLIAAAALFATSLIAEAQQMAPAPDPAFLTKAITSLQAQRNAAMDQQAALDAALVIAKEQLATANNKIKDLEEQVKKLQESKAGEESHDDK